MAADFTIADGRMGSVSCLLAEFDQYGESALLDQARMRAAQAAGDRYRAPGHDRNDELH